MKRIGTLEIVFGLLLVVASSYALLESSMRPELDRHGFGLMIGMFGASFGALLAFAGLAAAGQNRWRMLGHVPLLLFSAVVYFTWVRVGA